MSNKQALCLIVCCVAIFLALPSVSHAASTFCYPFGTNLKYGDKSADVIALQKFLNQDPQTVVDSSGLGSPGNETNFFGSFTMQAVARFQEKYASTVLNPFGLSQGTGYVGIASRLQMIVLCLQGLQATGQIPATLPLLPAQPILPVTPPPFIPLPLSNPSSSNYTNKFLSWYQIGGSIDSTPENQLIREVGWFPPTPNYWNAFVNRVKTHEIANGVKRIVIWCPFGYSYDSPEPIQFDQYLNAQQDTPWLVNNFVAAWKPITQSGVEVVAYIGSPYIDETQVALINNPTAWWDRAWKAVEPFMDAGMSIGFDAIVGQPASSMDYQFAEALRDEGVDVYVESRPRYNLAHWNDEDYGIIIDNNWYYRSNPEVYPDAIPWQAIKNSDLEGEVIRFVTYENGDSIPNDVPGDYIGQGKVVLEEGDSLAMAAGLITTNTPITTFFPSN